MDAQIFERHVMEPADIDLATCAVFSLFAFWLAAGLVGWLCERQQSRRTMYLNLALGDFVEEPEPIPSIVRRQGPARQLECAGLAAEEIAAWDDVIRDQHIGG
jgi:hypothetical protein